MANANKLNIFYQNVRGLRTKTDVFQRQLLMNLYDIIVLTETWLTDGICDSEFFDSRYIVWRRDRDYSMTGQSRGGGVLIATRRELSAMSQPQLHSTAEDLWISIRFRKSHSRNYVNLYICVVYLCKQNNGLSFTSQLTNFLTKLNQSALQNSSDMFLVLGDFNMSSISWLPSDNLSLNPVNLTTYDECLLADELSVLDFSQYNGIANKYGKILDLAISSHQLTVTECLDPLVPTDPYHPALLIEMDFFDVPPLAYAPRTRYMFDRGDYQSLNNDISAINWEHEFSRRSIDESVEFFNQSLYELQKKYIPQKSNRPNSYPIWYSPSLIKVIKEKHKYSKKFKIYGNRSDELTFKLLRDRVRIMESSCYKKYIELTETSIKSNPKYFWTYVKNKYNSNSIPSTLKYNGNTFVTGESICDAFSAFFLSTFLDSSTSNTQLTFNCSSDNNLPGPTSDICNIEVKTEEITSLLQSLDTTKGAGPDDLSSKLLSKCSSSVARPIALLFKKSLALCVVPKIWKAAYITPIHKKGSKSDITNYRPISKLCIVMKVFERVIHNQLYSALVNSFSSFQHGFLKGRSTTTNLILFNEFITSSMDDGMQVDVVYTDYSKAFDRIDHNILIRKLQHMGIHGDLLRWFSSYIENRTQAVVLHNYRSSWVSIPSGVPQGSLLGPLLFVIYVNDIDSCFQSSKLLCFADDMKIYSSISSFNDMFALQADLCQLEEYCRLNKLDLNPTKCSVVTYTRKRAVLDTSYTIEDQTLPRHNVIRDLGVHHDSKLLFDSHIDLIVKKASKSLGFIMRLSKCFTQAKTLKILFCTFVRGNLEYASQIWNPLYHKYIDRVENIQKRFLKFLCYHQKVPYESSNYFQLCKKFHLLPLSNRREIADFILLLKIINSTDIDSPELLAKFYHNVPCKATRFNPPLHIPCVSTNYRQNSYIVRASRHFNKLCKQHNLDPFACSVSSARRCLSLNFFK